MTFFWIPTLVQARTAFPNLASLGLSILYQLPIGGGSLPPFSGHELKELDTHSDNLVWINA